MSVFHLRFTSQIRAPPENIFDLVADMPNYGRWLPNSEAFGGTTDVRPYPVRLGTTYLDAGPVQKPGVVTDFERPTRIGFQQLDLTFTLRGISRLAFAVSAARVPQGERADASLSQAIR